MMQSYKKQGIYVLLGFVAFLFPFFKTSYFLLTFLILALIFLMLSPESPVFQLLAREYDVKAGKLMGLVQLFFTTAILLAINLFAENFPLFIIGAAFAITTFGDGIADIVNIFEKAKLVGHKNEVKFYSAKSSIVFLISGSASAFIAGAWISGFTLQVPYGILFFLAVIGALTGALLESITSTEDNIIIPFGSAMVMWLFYTFGYNVDTMYLAQALVFSFLLGYLAYRARIADISAMLSATLIGVVIIISAGSIGKEQGISLFLILLAFFFLGSLFTRYKYGYKLSHGIAEAKGGVRGYKNVFGNSLAALSLAAAYGIFPIHAKVLLSAYLGSVATACADTLASEIGETSKGEPRMITTFKKVSAGMDGAITSLGEAAALFGAAVIAILTFVLIKNDISLVVAVIAGGFTGANIDSLLGATLQQKGYLSNNGVNLFATISGAIISGIIYYSMGS